MGEHVEGRRVYLAQPSARARTSPSSAPPNSSCIRHSRTQPSAMLYAGAAVMVTVERSPGEAVVKGPAVTVASATAALEVEVAVLKSNGFPPAAEVTTV